MEQKVSFLNCNIRGSLRSFIRSNGVVIENYADNEPRIFQVLSDFDSDIEKAELRLKVKIKKGINKRYLGYKDSNFSIGQDLEVAGRILWGDTLKKSGFDSFFQIDNEKITVERFIDMLKGFEGWNFKLQILDPTDEID